VYFFKHDIHKEYYHSLKNPSPLRRADSSLCANSAVSLYWSWLKGNVITLEVVGEHVFLQHLLPNFLVSHYLPIGVTRNGTLFEKLTNNRFSLLVKFALGRYLSRHELVFGFIKQRLTYTWRSEVRNQLPRLYRDTYRQFWSPLGFYLRCTLGELYGRPRAHKLELPVRHRCSEAWGTEKPHLWPHRQFLELTHSLTKSLFLTLN